MHLDYSLVRISELLTQLELSTIHIELRTELRAVILDTIGTFVADKVDASAAQSAESLRQLKLRAEHEALRAKAAADDKATAAANKWAALHDEADTPFAVLRSRENKAGRSPQIRKPKKA